MKKNETKDDLIAWFWIDKISETGIELPKSEDYFSLRMFEKSCFVDKFYLKFEEAEDEALDYLDDFIEEMSGKDIFRVIPEKEFSAKIKEDVLEMESTFSLHNEDELISAADENEDINWIASLVDYSVNRAIVMQTKSGNEIPILFMSSIFIPGTEEIKINLTPFDIPKKYAHLKIADTLIDYLKSKKFDELTEKANCIYDSVIYKNIYIAYDEINTSILTEDEMITSRILSLDIISELEKSKNSMITINCFRALLEMRKLELEIVKVLEKRLPFEVFAEDMTIEIKKDDDIIAIIDFSGKKLKIESDYPPKKMEKMLETSRKDILVYSNIYIKFLRYYKKTVELGIKRGFISMEDGKTNVNLEEYGLGKIIDIEKESKNKTVIDNNVIENKIFNMMKEMRDYIAEHLEEMDLIS